MYPRKRYEVDANIISKQGVASYATDGWDLTKIFDKRSDSLKKRLAHRVGQKQMRSRYASGPSLPEPSNTSMHP